MPLYPSPQSINVVMKQQEYILGINVTKSIQAAVNKAWAVGIPDAMRAISNGLEDQIKNRRGLDRVNKNIAAAAQRSVVAAYRSRVTGRKRYESYRIGQNRYSGGRLGAALEGPDMFVGTYQGIAFGNRGILDQEAKHWYRLNYGAGGIAESEFQASQATLRIAGKAFAIVKTDPGPSAAFNMPRGIWVNDGESMSAGFYPTARDLTVPTRGIAGRRFLDVGLERIAKEIGPGYEDLLNAWIDLAVRQGKGQAARTIVKALIQLSH